MKNRHNMSSHLRVFRCTDSFSKCRERGDYFNTWLPLAYVWHVVSVVWHALPDKYRLRHTLWQTERRLQRYRFALTGFNPYAAQRRARGDLV